MERTPHNRASELMASIVEQNRKTAEQVEELHAMAAELRRQADEIDKAISTVTGLSSTAAGSGSSVKDRLADERTKILRRVSQEASRQLQGGPDHSRTECRDTAVGGCFWHSDAC
jgi:ABC-type transporter Mla subunit MlaD